MNVPSLPGLFVLALCLTLAYEASGSLLVPIGMHALFNLSQLVALYVQATAPAT
jgi:membrane protease YdiL (CAAX protease family)